MQLIALKYIDTDIDTYGVISLVSKMGGARAIAEALAKRAKTPSCVAFYWLPLCTYRPLHSKLNARNSIAVLSL